jgi:hypothetical protein
MKKLFAVMGVALLIVCAKQEPSTVKGTVSFADGKKSDSLYVGLYRMSNHRPLGIPRYYQATTKPSFAFNADPGQYTIAVWAFGYEQYRGKILIIGLDDPITLDILLQRKGAPNKISKVLLVGDYCDWNDNLAVEMVKRGKVWKVPDQSVLKKGQAYKFNVEKSPLYNLGAKNYVSDKEWATLDNVYTGEEIVFDPSLYLQQNKESTAEITGFDKLDDFLSATEILDKFNIGIREYFSKRAKLKGDELENVYDLEIKNKLDSLTALHDDYFETMFKETKLSLMVYAHPAYLKMMDIGRNNSDKNDTTKLTKYKQSKAFLDYYEENLQLLKSLDPTSPMLQGLFSPMCQGSSYSPGAGSRYSPPVL